MKNSFPLAPVNHKFFIVFTSSKVFLMFGFILLTTLGTFHLVRAYLDPTLFLVLANAFFAQGLFSFVIYFLITFTMLKRRIRNWKSVKNFFIFLLLNVLLAVILGIIGLLGAWIPNFLSARTLFFSITCLGIIAMFFGVGIATQINLIWEKMEKDANFVNHESQEKTS